MKSIARFASILALVIGAGVAAGCAGCPGRCVMVDVSADQLKQAVESQHGGRAALVDALPVKEVFQGKTVWEGIVHVFDLERHPKATRAYAWSSPIEGSTKRRFYAALHLGGIRSPLDAVRAAIVAETRRA